MSREYILDCEMMTDREKAHEYIAKTLNIEVSGVIQSLEKLG